MSLTFEHFLLFACTVLQVWIISASVSFQIQTSGCSLLSLLFSHSVMSDSLWPHGLQQIRLPCPSPSPRTCPMSHWCHPTISASVVPFSCFQSFPESRSFLINCHNYKAVIYFFTSYLQLLCLGIQFSNIFLKWTKHSWGASLVDQIVKNLPGIPDTWLWSLGWEDLLVNWMATHSSIPAWIIPWSLRKS